MSSTVEEQLTKTHIQQYKERWPLLLSALKQKPQHSYFTLEPINAEKIEFLSSNCYYIPPPSDIKSYTLDAISVLCAELLSVKPGMKVLDLCAAPGGKSLVLHQNLKSDSKSKLVCNEYSTIRRKRLEIITKEYNMNVTITGFDGCEFMKKSFMFGFDRCLVDAPCSSDRHCILNNELPSSPLKMQERQVKLLIEGIKCLKKGGFVMYSTCALSHKENDGVVFKSLKKMGLGRECCLDLFDVFKERNLEKVLERTDLGFIALPDKCGWGPLYMCLIKKP